VRQVRPARGELRLTRRGRVVVTLLMLVIVLVALTMFSGYSAATREPGTGVDTRTVVVDQGDTLWAIATEAAGERDVREVVHEIQRLNSLPGPELVEGQELAVPVG
jgi:cell division protein YceG involved in septum cleavage